MFPQHVVWATSEVAIELQLDEQVVCQDLISEQNKSSNADKKLTGSLWAVASNRDRDKETRQT